MGSLQPKPTGFAGQISAGPMAAGHISTVPPARVGVSAWLAGLLAALASDEIAPWHDEALHVRRREIPFQAVLAAVEGGAAGSAVEAAVADTAGKGAVADTASKGAVAGNAAAVQIALYQRWIAANQGVSELVHAAWFNLGVLFGQIGDRTNAAIAYANALALRPDMAGAAINLGLVFEASGQPDEALATWEPALQPDAVRLALEIQRGRLLEKLGRLDEAEQVLRRVLLMDPSQADVIHHWVHIRQKACQWPAAPDSMPGLTAAELVHGSGPLGILALTDNIDLQREAAGAWVARKTVPAPRRLAPLTPYGHDRIRIGYMSSDFCSHAMSYLITELFERHDRGRFEVFGYCASHDDGTELRKRALAAFDHCRLIRTLSDEQAAQLIRDDEIDVLIDLNGITDGSRLSILRWRPAPIQATYLGFIGPLPMPELDYLLCDSIVVPPEHEAAYQPAPLPIARVYQANDSKRTIGRVLSRAEVGLPDDCFVFCCFSKHYKITETVFAAWMAILRDTGGSVLWLARDNPYSEANLKAAAERAGIAAGRLVFADRADPDLYLSRLGVADLFLDTFPYNAGTVASDAIRMRLPLVTLCGEAFASRMAASLLYAIGAKQGITTAVGKYVGTAVALADDRRAYEQYKALFTEQAWSRTIGDIAGFTAQFEATWCRIVGNASGR